MSKVLFAQIITHVQQLKDKRFKFDQDETFRISVSRTHSYVYLTCLDKTVIPYIHVVKMLHVVHMWRRQRVEQHSFIERHYATRAVRTR